MALSAQVPGPMNSSVQEAVEGLTLSGVPSETARHPDPRNDAGRGRFRVVVGEGDGCHSYSFRSFVRVVWWVSRL